MSRKNEYKTPVELLLQFRGNLEAEYQELEIQCSNISRMIGIKNSFKQVQSIYSMSPSYPSGNVTEATPFQTRVNALIKAFQNSGIGMDTQYISTENEETQLSYLKERMLKIKEQLMQIRRTLNPRYRAGTVVIPFTTRKN